MIELTYEQVCDIHTSTWLMEFPDIAKQQINLQLVDAKVRMYVPDAIFNMICWHIYVKFNFPITVDRIIPRIALNSNNLADVLTNIHDEIAYKYPEKEFERKDTIFKTINYLYNFAVEELNAYVSTVTMQDLCEIITDPKIKKLKNDMHLTIDQSTDVIEKKINIATTELLKYLKTEGELENQALINYQQTGILNKFQIPQMLIAYGPRTDVDDVIIRYPVLECTVEGLSNVKSFAVEGLSAKKSAFYNRVAVSESQYSGRKQHIVSSTISKIYNGDCGTDRTITFRINERNYKNVVGKYFVENGQLLCFRKDSEVKTYVGKEVQLRSPLVCKHKDGYCSICGGLITRNINKKINAGILGSIAVIEPTTQKILSAKHFVKTTSQVYDVPHEATDYLIRLSADCISWVPGLYKELSNLEMGVSNKDLTAGALSDIQYLIMDKHLDEAKYSNITEILLRNKTTGGVTYIPLMNNNQSPFFSKEYLMYLRDHYKQIIPDQNTYWLPIDGTQTFPIFKSTVVNDNMMMFIKSVTSFLESRIDEYTSASAALRDFTDIVYSKVDNAALMHLEVLLKAYLITSPDDYRIPEITDPEHVTFQTLGNIINNRSIGQKFAYEDLGSYIASPLSYIVPKGVSVFDAFVGIVKPDPNELRQ